MLTVIVPGVCASEAFSYSGEDALGIASSDEHIEEMSQPELSKAIFSIDGATTDVKTGITSDSKDTDELEKQYGVLNIPSTVLTYDAVSFKTVKLNKEGENSIKVYLYGKEYDLILERSNFENIDDGIDSYNGYIKGLDNSVALFTFDESMGKSLVHGFIEFENEQVYVVPVQTRENGLKTDNPLHIIYSSKGVANPTEEQIAEIEKRSSENTNRLGVTLPDAGKFPITSDLPSSYSPSSWATVYVLVATDYEFHELETNWVSSAQSYMNHAAYQYQRPDIGVFLNVAEYDDSKMYDLSNDARKTSEPLILFMDKFPASYLDSKNADIAVYLGGNDITTGQYDTSQGLSYGYSYYNDPYNHNNCRYTWSQMVADRQPPIIGRLYDGSLNARRYCVIHELGHIFDANHEDSQGTNKAYLWLENGIPKLTVMWSYYLGTMNTCEYSSPSYHGDSTHDNAGAIRAVKHNIAALV
jgi:hypothetical protein